MWHILPTEAWKSVCQLKEKSSLLLKFDTWKETVSSLIPFWVPAAAAKLFQSCPTLSDPIDGSPPGSPVPGILKARTWEWVAISFSNAWKWKVKVELLSRVWPSATPWTEAHQAPPPMGFSRQEYWSGVPLPSPTGRPGMLQFMGSQRVGHDWGTELNWIFHSDAFFRQAS